MSIGAKFRKSLDEKWSMRFKSSDPDGDCYDGIVMAIRNSFIVLREERDFEFQGILILPKRAIKGYRDGKYERCTNEILRHNHQIDRLKIPNWLTQCGTLPELFRAFQQRDIWPIVDILFDGDSQLYIGPVVEVTDQNFHIRHYTAQGAWDRYYVIDYPWLLRVEFDDKYSKHFNAFMRDRLHS